MYRVKTKKDGAYRRVFQWSFAREIGSDQDPIDGSGTNDIEVFYIDEADISNVSIFKTDWDKFQAVGSTLIQIPGETTDGRTVAFDNSLPLALQRANTVQFFEAI